MLAKWALCSQNVWLIIKCFSSRKYLAAFAVKVNKLNFLPLNSVNLCFLLCESLCHSLLVTLSFTESHQVAQRNINHLRTLCKTLTLRLKNKCYSAKPYFFR